MLPSVTHTERRNAKNRDMMLIKVANEDPLMTSFTPYKLKDNMDMILLDVKKIRQTTLS